MAKAFKKTFVQTVGKLNNFDWPSNNQDETNETLIKIIKKVQSYLSVIKIKSKYSIQETFSFQLLTAKDVEKIDQNISNNKASVLYVLIMSHTHFRVNPHSIVA